MSTEYDPAERRRKYLSLTDQQREDMATNQRKRWHSDEDYRQQRLASAKAWRQRNADKLKAKRAIYLEENKERLAENRRSKRQKVNARLRERRANDPNYRLSELLRNRLNREIKRCKGNKTNNYLVLLGCDLATFRRHIEDQFLPGMSWSNHGMWHIDHVKPCSSFDLTDEKQQAICFHFSNLQPLWALDNMKKGSRLL